MELFEALANRRREIKMSFEELNAVSKIPVSTLKKIFTGVTTNPPFETVRSIAYAMGITTDDIIAAMDEVLNLRPSPAALALARKYDAMDEHGRKVLDSIADLESQRLVPSYADEVERFNQMSEPSIESSAL